MYGINYNHINIQYDSVTYRNGLLLKKSLIKSETEPTERVRVKKIDEQLKFGGGKDERSLVKTQINTQRGISHIRRFIWILPDISLKKYYRGFKNI